MRKLISAPSNLGVSLEEAKNYLRVDVSDTYDDNLITSLIKASTLKAEGILGTQLTDATYLEALSGFKSQIELKAPLKTVTSIKYYDVDNVLQTIANTNYTVQIYGLNCKVVFNNDFEYPSTYYRDDSVLIEYVSGYEVIPEDIKIWIQIQLATGYESREVFSDGYGTLKEINPKYVAQFLAPHRTYK